MFFEIPRHKFILLSVIFLLLFGSIGAFLVVDRTFDVIAQASYLIARNVSGLRYAIFYGSSYQLAEAATTTVPARSIPVLLYHGESGGADMPTAVFIDQMRALKQAGWQTITMEQYDQWQRGEITLPDKSFMLTFDDGRTDTFYPVDPVLQDLHYTAIMFVITGFSLPPDGKPINGFYLDRAALENMVHSGRWEIESHGDHDHALYAVQSTTDLSQTASTTAGHYLSNVFWNEEASRFETPAEYSARVRADLVDSKETLERELGISVIGFAYPFNDFGENSVNFPDSQQLLAQLVPSVYTYAFYQTWPGNGGNFNQVGQGYLVKRIEPSASWSGQELLAFLDRARAKPLPYESSDFGADWEGTWGGSSPNGASGLVLRATDSTTGAAAFLDGTGWWADYRFDADIRWTGSSVSLLARDSEDDYVACAFSGSYVTLERRRGDVQTTLAKARRADGTTQHAQLGIGVAGRQVTCYEGTTPIVSARSSDVATHGGIGIEIWDKTPGVARATLGRVSVRAVSSVALPAAAAVAASAAEAPSDTPTAEGSPADAPTSTPRANAAPAAEQGASTRGASGQTPPPYTGASSSQPSRGSSSAHDTLERMRRLLHGIVHR